MDKKVLELLREIHDRCQEWLKEIEGYMVENNDFKKELLKIDDALRVVSQNSHYILKEHN